MDATKKLELLDHLGGDPLAFFAARGKTTTEDYDVIAKMFERVGYYVEQLMMEQVDPDQQQAWETLKKDMMPLVERAGAVTRDKLVPSMADGQGALVLDAKSTSAQWHVMMPPSGVQLPMFELAIVQSVTDADKLKEAFADYFTILQEALDKLHVASTGELKDFFPDEIPKIELAKPRTQSVGDGTVYYYVLPGESGLDAQIAPNAGLSTDTLVASLMPKHTQRLLNTTPLQGSGPLTNLDRPLGAAMHLNFTALIEVIEPWIDYGMQVSGGQNSQLGGMVQQAVDALDVLKCFRGVSAVTYQEGDAMVTHAQWKFEDLP
jgi:hypothetical protein